MKSTQYRLPKALLAIFIAAITATSCENKLDLIPKSDLLTLPSLTVRDFKTVFTDSGKIQLILTSPLMEQYDNNELPYSEFRKGIKVNFYEGHKEPEASVTANYARYTKSDNLWELKDSVIVINEDGDKLETEVLFWDQKKDLIYSDRFVRITNQDQIVMGTGFESDPRLQRRRIRKVSATITLRDEE